MSSHGRAPRRFPHGCTAAARAFRCEVVDEAVMQATESSRRASTRYSDSPAAAAAAPWNRCRTRSGCAGTGLSVMAFPSAQAHALRWRANPSGEQHRRVGRGRFCAIHPAEAAGAQARRTQLGERFRHQLTVRKMTWPDGLHGGSPSRQGPSGSARQSLLSRTLRREIGPLNALRHARDHPRVSDRQMKMPSHRSSGIVRRAAWPHRGRGHRKHRYGQ